jgi:MFS family permease
MGSTKEMHSHIGSWINRSPFFHGWTVLAIASLAMFTSGPGQTYAVSIFVDPLIRETGWTRTDIAALYAAGSLTAACAMIFVGRLFDRWGARILIALIVILFGLAALWMSSIHSPFELYLGFAAIRTLGQGSLTMIPTSLIAVWFIRLRGRATAIAFLGTSLSQAMFPPVIHFLIAEFGWRGAWVALAVIIWSLLLIPTIAFVRRSPESVGLHPDGDDSSAELGDGVQDARNEQETDWTLREAMKTRALWLLLLAGSSQALIGTALVFHQVSIFSGKGLDASVAASVFTVMAPCAIVASLIAGFLSDKVPNRFVLAAGQVLMLAGMLLIFVISSVWHAFLYGAVMGFAQGVIMTTNAVIWPNYFGRRHIGSIRGAATTSMVAFAAVGPLPFAYVFDVMGSYTTVILLFLLLPLSCVVAALLALPPKKMTLKISENQMPM